MLAQSLNASAQVAASAARPPAAAFWLCSELSIPTAVSLAKIQVKMPTVAGQLDGTRP